MPTISLPPVPITFAHPAAFLLLGIAVILFLVHRASLRGLTRGRRRFVLALRLIILLLTVTSLAGPLALSSADTLGVAFLIDRSDSVSPDAQHEALDWVRRAMATKGARDQGEVIAFGREAYLDRPLSAAADVPDITSTPNEGQTNLAAAIQLAVSTLPSNLARKIVVLSDGAENAGNAAEEARLAGAAGIPVSFVPLSARDGPEVLVRQVETPSTLREQDTFNVKVVVDANVATSAVAHLLIDGRLDATLSVQLNPGTNAFTIPHAPLAKGFHSFQVQLEPAEDTLPENNEGSSYSVVLGKAKVLIVEGTTGAGRYLADALRAGGVDVEVRRPANLPANPAQLRDFDSAILANVRADQLSQVQQLAVKTYVQSLGGGLAVVGGNQSYGAGGYAKTPLEDVLPVRMDLKGRKIQSSVAIILVIDTSGSMGEGPAGATKMDLAKQAAIKSVELLGEQDQIGVLAFEDGYRWVVQPTYLNDPEQVKRQIGSLAPGGGTEIFPALKEAYQAMAKRQAKVRHIILMTDGLAPNGDYDGLTAQMRQDNITLSTIAIGSDADFGLLQRLADRGNGRYYEGIDPFDVPQLTVKETLEVARAAIVEEQVPLVRVGSSAILDGLDLSKVPALSGYVATTAKPSSTTILASKEQDPLLVEWQYGLGEVVAWTSDAENRWAADWLRWSQFSQFWTQLVKRTIPAHLDRNLQVAIQPEGTRAHIVVDSVSDSGSYLNFLQSEAGVIDPKGNKQTVPLQQTAPGRYEGYFPAGEEGSYSVEVAQRNAGDNTLVAAQTGGFVVPYSPEYRELGGNEALLAAIAQQTGGAQLSAPEQGFVPPARSAGGGRELWPFLVGAALLLFLVDVAFRRLRVGPDDIRRGWHLLVEAWRTRSRPIAQPAADRLLLAKRRLSAGGTAHPLRLAARDAQPHVAISRSASHGADKQSGSEESTAVAAMGARLIEAKKRAAKEKQPPSP